MRGFVQALDTGPLAAVQARLVDRLDGLVDGPPMISLRVAAPDALERLAEEGAALAPADRARVRLVLGQLPVEWTPPRLAEAYVLAGWCLGSEAARLLPLEPLFDAAARPPSRAALLRAGLEAVAPALAADGRAVLLLEPDGPPGLAGAALAAATAGWRVVDARLAEPAPGRAAASSSSPRRAGWDPGRGRGRIARWPRRPAAPATRGRSPVGASSGRPRPSMAGSLPRRRPGQSPRRRWPSSRRAASRPSAIASSGRSSSPWTAAASSTALRRRRPSRRRFRGRRPRRPVRSSRRTFRTPGPAPRPRAPPRPRTPGPAPRPPGAAATRALLELIDGEMLRPDQRRLAPSDEGRLWLADPHDEADAAAPLADRLEWAVFSLLGTEAAASEAALREGIGAMFAGSDTPDPWLVDACLKSYAEPGIGRPRLAAVDHLQRRTEEHTATIALLADLGHALGLHVYIAPREQGRRTAGRLLAARLAPDERGPGLSFLGRAGADAVELVDCLWYARPRFAFLFEVEWTAMLGEPVLQRGRQIAPDDRIVRFLVIVPERSELLRAKLRHSPVLRRAMDEGNWHILRADALRRFAALPAPSLEDLQPYLGLDPAADSPGDQLPLFGG